MPKTRIFPGALNVYARAIELSQGSNQVVKTTHDYFITIAQLESLIKKECMVPDTTDETWIIWSIEHNAWWMADHRGYTDEVYKAGLYSFKDAKRIVADANKFCKDKPNEAMIQFSPDL